MGAPRKHDRDKVMAEVCDRLERGEFVNRIGPALGVPAQKISEWGSDPEYRDAYARARVLQSLHYVAAAHDVASGTDALGQLAEQCADLSADEMEPEHRREFLAKFDNVRVQRDRLRVDTLKWTASKLDPRNWGDKIDVTTAGEKLPAAQVMIVAGQEVKF